MKKYVIGFISGLIVSACTVSYAANELQTYLFPVHVYLNGENKRMEADYEALTYNGRAYLPARFIVELMGGSIYYSQEQSRLSIVDEKLADRDDLHSMSVIIMEYAKNGELQKASSVIDSYQGEELDRLFLNVTKYVFKYAEEPHMDDLIRLFLEKKVNLEIRNKENGYTPLLVLANQTPSLMPLLIEANANVNATDNNGFTPLNAAASRGMTDLVQQLLAKGADPNGGGRLTPLHNAVFPMFANYREETYQTVKLLLDAKADVNRIDEEGRTPIIAASQLPEIAKPIIELLLERGADPTVKDNTKRNALHHCAKGGDAELIGRLLKAGTPIDEQDGDGNTALSYAVESNNHLIESNAEIIKLLLAKGANPRLPDKSGATPIDKARLLENESIRSEMLTLLQQ